MLDSPQTVPKANHDMVVLRTQIPRPWKERLVELSREQGNSVGSVVRILLRAGLYDRLPEKRE